MIAPLSSVVTFGRNGCVIPTQFSIRVGGVGFKNHYNRKNVVRS